MSVIAPSLCYPAVVMRTCDFEPAAALTTFAYSTMVDGIDDLVRHGLDRDTATQAAVDALVSASNTTAPKVVSALKRTPPRMLRQHRRRNRVFRRDEEVLGPVTRSLRRTQQEVVIEALQEYIRHHEDEQQRVAAVEDGLALLTNGDLDHPNRDSAWH